MKYCALYAQYFKTLYITHTGDIKIYKEGLINVAVNL